MYVLLEFWQKIMAIPIMNPLSWFMIIVTVQLSLRVRSHGLLVYRLCLLPDTPIIFIYLFNSANKDNY